jgi:hypothetical protein
MMHSDARIGFARRELESLAVSVLPHCMMANLVIQAGNNPEKFSAEQWVSLAVEVATLVRLKTEEKIAAVLAREDGAALIDRLAAGEAKGLM